MYSQSTPVMSRRRNVYPYRPVSARSRQRGASQERVRLIQLTVCLVLFLAVFLWKGVFPQKLNQVREDLFTLITTDLDFQEALAELGESLADRKSVV